MRPRAIEQSSRPGYRRGIVREEVDPGDLHASRGRQRRVLHVAAKLLPRTQTFVAERMQGCRFTPTALCWGKEQDSLPVPCSHLVLDEERMVAPLNGLPSSIRWPIGWVVRRYIRLRALRSLSPDVVHVHFGHIGLWLDRECVHLGTPLVVSFYGRDAGAMPRDPEIARKYKRLFANVSELTAEGPALARRLIELGADPRRVKLLPLSLPAWAMEPPPPRSASEPGALRLLLVARFVEKKGVDVAIEAVAAARQRGAAVTLEIVGDGELRPALVGLVRERDLADVVIFSGFRPHAELPEIFARADVLIQPSRTASDGDTEGGAPTVLIEAQAHELPIIATRHADIPNVTRDGRTGLLADEDDVDTLAGHIHRLAYEVDLRRRMGMEGRRFVLRRHSPGVLMRLRERIYREAIRRASASRC